jgi:NTE family protein
MTVPKDPNHGKNFNGQRGLSMTDKQSSRNRIALVIGSGGIKCTAAIGMWHVLQEEGIHVDSIVGCSGGSIYGTSFAKGESVETMQALSKSLWTGDIMQGYTANLKASKDGTLRFNERSGLVDDLVLNNNLKEVYGELTFSDLQVPLKIVATDLLTGGKVVLSEGSLFDAIRASMAIPIIFPPWEVDGRLLIDGAVSDPLPIDVAIQDGADIIIAMGFTLDYRTRFRSMTAVQEQLNSIYMNNILTSTYAFYNLAHHAEIFPILPEFDEPLSMFDVDKIPEVIERGEQATRAQLPHIKRLL